uniref:Ig-like domain-containing protein n=1 Tax=Maylandia zebra TaxID=106582 RepID=A0A3P9CW86_9CICH
MACLMRKEDIFENVRLGFQQDVCLYFSSGHYHVVGSLQPILAAPGDDVILPCRVEPKFNVAGLTVEWSRPDRRPDPNDRLSRVDYVHLYRDTREVPDMKIPSYVGRTALFTDGLREGNISLRITNVTQEDEGRYRCFIPKLKSQIQSSIVHLILPISVKLKQKTKKYLSHLVSLTRNKKNKFFLLRHVCRVLDFFSAGLILLTNWVHQHLIYG